MAIALLWVPEAALVTHMMKPAAGAWLTIFTVVSIPYLIVLGGAYIDGRARNFHSPLILVLFSVMWFLVIMYGHRIRSPDAQGGMLDLACVFWQCVISVLYLFFLAMTSRKHSN